ncbi:hypothetical protein ACQEWB_04685 [Streptomyces sp. CA-249302]
MSGPPGDRWEFLWLTAASAVAVLAVLRPDLYAAAAQHFADGLFGRH